MTALRSISPATARRLAITRQRLAGPRPPADAAGVLDLVRDLGCLQLDPISVLARSHLIVLWSRLGVYDPAHLDTLLWENRRLFEYWAHCASIVLTEHYPIHRPMMRAYGTDARTAWAQRRRAWVAQNRALHDHILRELAASGPLPSRYFEDRAKADWYSSGWTSLRNASQMLQYLWLSGRIMVASRTGGQKLWDLPERVLPDWTPRDELAEPQVTRRAAQTALRALGVGRLRDIKQHFIRGRYPGLPDALKELEATGCIMKVQIVEDGRAWPGPWYVHAEDLPLLDRLEAGGWQPRTTLLSPFDNLICDRDRTRRLFGFDYTIEIYVPKAKRRYGYYVLPILHGDRLIGRLDPVLDRKQRRLTVNAMYAEPDAPVTEEVGRAVAGAVEELAAFLGAREIAYAGEVPARWRAQVR